jgi:hypothetical protein
MIERYDKRKLLKKDLKKAALALYWGCNTLNEERAEKQKPPIPFEVIAQMHGIRDMGIADRLYSIAKSHLDDINKRRFLNNKIEA